MKKGWFGASGRSTQGRNQCSKFGMRLGGFELASLRLVPAG